MAMYLSSLEDGNGNVPVFKVTAFALSHYVKFRYFLILGGFMCNKEIVHVSHEYDRNES